ncbi:MAG: exosome complex protein Rrp42 [Candidatus Marsarchaeota archaeon]|nr:exosome complex protein Rrp42 [Candidatus Marsarchaeota archaeon]
MENLSSIDATIPFRQRELLSLLSTGQRMDGRKLDEYRQVEVVHSIYEKPEGSAVAKIGNTQAIAGVKVELGEPFPDTPNDGVLTVNLELLPHASPSFEPGPPDESAIEMSRIIDRGLRESKSISYDKLCVIPGQKVWIVYVDINAMDHDGNIVDTAGLAALAAVSHSTLPETRVEDSKVITLEERKPVPLTQLPVPVTVAKIGEYLLVDPSLYEETLSDVKVTMTTIESGVVASIQKSGSGTLDVDEVMKIYDLCYQKGNELREHVKSSRNGGGKH